MSTPTTENGTGGKKTSGLLLTSAILGGWAAGALTAVFLVRREIGKFRAGVAAPSGAPALRPAVAERPAPQSAATAAAVDQPEELSEETLAVISATIAAFLGKTARIRAVRRMPAYTMSSWAQQGRVYVQGSHNLGLQR
jgi:methylmalonyl-CoA carboxyltransferase 12S subunit